MTTPSSAACRRSPRSGKTAPAGSASSASGSGRSIRSRLASSSSPGPSPTVPRTSSDSTSLDDPAAVAKARRLSVMSQLRGEGHGPPRRVSVVGSRWTSAGRRRGGRTPRAGRSRRLRTAFRGRAGAGSRGPGATESADDDLVVVGPSEVDEAVGEGRAQLPAVGRRRTRVGGGHDPDTGRESEGADAPLQYETEERGLDGGRRGGQFVEEQQPLARPYQADGPVRRCHRHALYGGVVADDGQTGEVGRFVHAGDDRRERQPQGVGELGERRGLADPRLAQRRTGRSAETARVSASSWVSGRGSVAVSRSRLISLCANASWEPGAEFVGAEDGAWSPWARSPFVLRTGCS